MELTEQEKAILQEDFNKIWERAKDERVSIEEDSMGICMYRSPDGLKCFVGEIIPDELYQDTMEKNIASEVFSCNYADFFKARNSFSHAYDVMQRIHDRYDPEEWHDRLRMVAKDYALTVPQE